MEPQRQLSGSDPEGGETAFLQRQKKLRSTYAVQANALLRKNLIYQRRNCRTNTCLISMPIVLCLLLFLIQLAINALLNGSNYKCGCQCLQHDSSGNCVNKQCGIQYSKDQQVPFCGVPDPPEWPVFQQVGKPQYRAASNAAFSAGLPSGSCRNSGDCPVTFLYTGENATMADGIASLLLADPVNTSSLVAAAQSGNYLPLLASLTPATATWPYTTWLYEPAVTSVGYQADYPLYILRNNCSGSDSSVNVSLQVTSQYSASAAFQCLEALVLQRDDAGAINHELYDGYYDSNLYGQRAVYEYAGAYDFRTTSVDNFDANVFYNYTYANDTGGGSSPPSVIRFARAMNLAVNAFIRFITNDRNQLPMLFIKEFPKPETKLRLDFSSLLGPLFFMWLIQLLLPVILAAVLYEKQQNLRTMMKMHGLGNRAYWSISYLYFLIISAVYMIFFILFGSAVNLKFFRTNNYGIQVIFYFIFINTQIAFAFLLSTLFSSVKTATVSAYLYVFGTGLLGRFLYQFFLEDPSFSRGAVFAMQLIPAFALYRGLYEFAQYSFVGSYLGTHGMQFSNLGDSDNGLLAASGILLVEWAIFLPLAFYLDQVISSGTGVKKHPLFFLHGWLLKKPQAAPAPVFSTSKRIESEEMEADVQRELDLVDSLHGHYDGYAIVCDRLRKVFPARDGNPQKVAVRNMSVAIARGECFGMLGPNGAGKTTSINMMIGFLTPSSGTAVIEGLRIQDDMDAIYSIMGVCPQHDLLWEQLTGREHLLFYGRLKNLKGRELQQAVDESLRSVELYTVRHKRAGQYSGGMKRRLSVAISLIGNPLVVYMDEPSTGLDPASRRNLWKVVKDAKRDRAIILTTHSMEEAEALCDRLGIFVSGEFQCIGNPKELTARFGGSFVFTITTPPADEAHVERLALSLTRNARRIYSLAGTQKFELPTSEVDVADVFTAVEKAKGHINIQAWGVSNTTLEDVFIRIAKGAVSEKEGGDEQ